MHISLSRPLFFKALLLAALIILADQISKFWILDVVRLAYGESRPVTDFFNLVLVYNRGVSFGLMNTGHDFMPLALSAFAGIIVCGLMVWLWRQQDPLLATALGMIIGGALGNVCDRLRFGAVVDFLDFHAFGWHWPAFNIADSCIVLGVGIIFLHGLVRPRPRD